MSYSNGILWWSGEAASSETVIVKGEKGDSGRPGIGFKLTLDGNYDLDGKKVFNIDSQDDIDIENYANKYIKDSTTIVNKENLNRHFLKKKQRSEFLWSQEQQNQKFWNILSRTVYHHASCIKEIIIIYRCCYSKS